MRPRKLALLFLLLGFGVAVETAHDLKTRMAIGPMGCRVLTGRFQGPSYSFETEQSREGLAADLALEVENAFGEVRVWKGEPGRVRLRVRKVVFLPSEQAARQLAERIETRLELQGDTLRVTTNRRELERTSDAGFETHLSLEVPPATRVRVRNEHGAAAVSDVRQADVWASYDAVRVERVLAEAQVDNRHGDVFAEAVGGALTLKSRYGTVRVEDVAGLATLGVEHGNATVSRVGGLKATLNYGDLAAEAVRGELEVHGRHAAVKAHDVTGRAQVETSYRDVELRQVGGDAHVKAQHSALAASLLAGALSVETSYDDVEATDVAGPVSARVAHGGFRGRGLRQGARVQTSGDDVELAAFEGPVEVEAQRGSVRLLPEKALLDALSASALRGAVRLLVPPDSHFELDASASRGEVNVDVPDLTLNESSSTHVRGRLGKGGKTVTLRSAHGDVTVEAQPRKAALR